MYRDGFFCPLAKMLMGETAETLAVQYKITREEQDRFALVSQQHAATAQSSGRFDAEIAPVKIEGKEGKQPFSLVTNTVSRRNAGEDGEVIAGVFQTGHDYCRELSGITDGAAAVVLASEKFPPAKQSEAAGANSAATSAAWTRASWASGPFQPFAKLEQKHGLKLNDFDLVELNEAFAAQCACDRELHFDREKLNVTAVPLHSAIPSAAPERASP